MSVILTFTIILIMFAPMLSLTSNGFAIALVILASVLLIIMIKRNADITKHNLNSSSGKELIIQNVKKGGVIKLTHIDGHIDTLDLKVINKHLYMEGDYSWFELECIDGNGEKFWIDVDDDDELIVSVVLKKLNASDLKFSSSLFLIDENEKGQVNYDGKTFFYTDSGEANFYRFCDDKRKETFYYWEFKSPKYPDYSISVEEWKNFNGRPDKEYFYSQNIKPSTITIYSLGGENTYE